MVIHRRPVPRSPQNSTQQPLPYPPSPTGAQEEMDDIPRNEYPEEYHTAGQFLQQPTLPQSHSTDDVSDLSDGWVDGGMASSQDLAGNSQTDQTPTRHGLDTVPQSLRVGEHSNHSHTSSLASLTNDNGFENLERPGTNHSNRSNNPFHRARSSDSRNRLPHQAPAPGETDIWTEITSPPPQQPLQAPPRQLSSMPDIGRIEIGDDSDTLPVDAASAPRSYSANHGLSKPSVDDTSRQSFELPASPVQRRDGAKTENDQNESDVWAELDAAFTHSQYSSTQPTEQVPTHAQEPVQSVPGSWFQPPSQAPQDVFEQASSSTTAPVDGAHASTVIKEKSCADYGPDSRAQTSAPASSSTVLDQKQRSETYQIKQIRWLDDSTGNINTTPIVVQNANGPCPLLALVNALTLSTPSNMDTALIETLRSREQVSLGLLLDAVFDELMSGRRGGAAQELPDMTELYSFLLTLHTGMNVNPRFVPPTVQTQPLIAGLDQMAVTDEDFRKPGGFEDTREMKLYGTFAIPLVHGWLAPKRHPAYGALKRSANTYEDAQNLMFHEEELEDKLQQQGLSTEEQQLLQDISSIKSFLNTSATQLTGYGLDIVSDTMTPGGVAILFRNDHFSTLYKHPRSGQLLSLVTDFGYAGHEEVVWESLVDVSGEACEFYSGDFRPVGTAPASQQQPSHQQQDDSGWTTVARNNRPHVDTSVGQVSGVISSPADDAAPFSPSRNTEQEDADLALAMQLQEEEEDRQRRASQQRRDEEQASQAYISGYNSVGQGPNAPRAPNAPNTPNTPSTPQPAQPAQPPQRGGYRQRGGRRPSQTPPQLPARHATSGPTPPRRENSIPVTILPSAPSRPADPEGGTDVPPPTYEQAAKAAPYTGPIPAPGGASGGSSQSYAQMRASNGAPVDPYTRTRGPSAYSQHRASLPGQGPPSPEAARRRASGAQGSAYGTESPVAAGLPPMPGSLSRGSTAEAALRRERERDKDCAVM